MSLENLDDITDDELVAAGVDLDDPDSIDAFLEGRDQPERDDVETETEQDEEQGDTSGQAQTEKPETESEEPAATDSEESEQEDEAEPRVLTADGKHEIPFAEHKKLRTDLSEAKRQIGELTQMAERSKKLEAFMEKNGIDFDDPDNITEKNLEEMADLDPTYAKSIRVLLKKVDDLSGRLQQPSEPDNSEAEDVERDIAANPDLVQWRKDPERWKEAQAIDAKLFNDPAWQGRPQAERFAEVVRRSKLINGEAVDSPTSKKSRDKAPTAAEKAAAKVAEAEQQGKTPTSLSHMGKSPSTEKSIGQQLSDKSEDELVDMMIAGKISDEQLDAALEELGFQ
ncbi:hypothetical protein [uncultured Gilvimarinus sp.]|uniref:hypothetical protein n=1 Tax=uncultured Gilvimarinus sp. TaxID=1689143 RepID=UPI0030ECE66E|tara:strand:+ start:1438 stop:2457 length:1020 start_codon:yes stop_codon:yes gene_type:complete